MIDPASARAALCMPREVLDELEAGALFVVNHSAGKDSQAMMALLRAVVPAEQLLVIHADLGGVEWPGLVEHIRATAPDLPLIVCRNENKTFLEMVEQRGMWPSAQHRQCTSDLKRGPIEREVRRYLKAHPRFAGRIVNCMGMRAEESASRRKLVPFKRNAKNSKAGRAWFDWLPVHALSTQDVFRVIEAAGQTPHPVYEMGMSRLSCCFCIMASRADLTTAARLNPELYRTIVELEKRIDHTLSMSGEGLETITGIPAEPAGDATDRAGNAAREPHHAGPAVLAETPTENDMTATKTTNVCPEAPERVTLRTENDGACVRAFAGDRCLATALRRRVYAEGPAWSIATSDGYAYGTAETPAEMRRVLREAARKRLEDLAEERTPLAKYRKAFAATTGRITTPVKAGEPFRAWLQTRYVSCSWTFATREEAVAYLRAQAERCGVGSDGSQRNASGGIVETVNPYDSFLQTPDGFESLLDLGIAEPLDPCACYNAWRVLPAAAPEAEDEGRPDVPAVVAAAGERDIARGLGNTDLGVLGAVAAILGGGC